MRRLGRLLAVVLVIAALQPLFAGYAFAGTKVVRDKVEPALAAAARSDPTATFHVVVTAVADADANGTGRAADAVRKVKGRTTHALGIVGGASAVLTGAALLALANDKDVASIVEDRSFRATFDPVTGAAAEGAAGLREIGAPAVWSTYGLTGRGVTVAVVDSGVASHPDLGSRIVAAIDFTAPTPTVSKVPLGDPGGHGTHVAGLIAGDGTSSAGVYAGVAPNANIVDVRVIGADGSTTLSTVLMGLQWILRNRTTYNIRVVNLSFGATARLSYVNDLLATAAEVLTFAGVSVVVAAGNGGPGAGTITTPGTDPFVITVGALDDAGTVLTTDDAIPAFSSQGPTAFDGIAKPDVVAPGRRMVSLRAAGSTLDTLYPDRRVSTSALAAPAYFVLSGTSMSAPVVAGVVALLLERDPTLTPGQIKFRLTSTATPLAFATAFSGGAGLVSASAAVASLDRSRGRSAFRITNAFANEAYTPLYGQTLVWRDLSYNGGVDSHGRPWSAVTWGDITWDDITWENLSWESFSWLDITWESLAANSITWESVDTLNVGSLSSGSGGGWELVD
jgi:serine protease AprX